MISPSLLPSPFRGSLAPTVGEPAPYTRRHDHDGADGSPRRAAGPRAGQLYRRALRRPAARRLRRRCHQGGDPGPGRPHAHLGHHPPRPGAVVAGHRPQQALRGHRHAPWRRAGSWSRRLAARVDVVLENFRPGRLDEWGLGYDELQSRNPGIIVVHVSGFGQTGPRAADAGFGSIGEAMGGIRATTGDPDRPPARCGISLGDALAGLFAVVGTLAALAERHATGRGQEVDVAIYEAVAALMESTLADFEVAGVTRRRTGGVLPGVAPSNAYPTADGSDVLIAGNADSVFTRLCAAMGQAGAGSGSAIRTITPPVVATWKSSTDSSPTGHGPREPTPCSRSCRRTGCRLVASTPRPTWSSTPTMRLAPWWSAPRPVRATRCRCLGWCPSSPALRGASPTSAPSWASTRDGPARTRRCGGCRVVFPGGEGDGGLRTGDPPPDSAQGRPCRFPPG